MVSLTTIICPLDTGFLHGALGGQLYVQCSSSWKIQAHRQNVIVIGLFRYELFRAILGPEDRQRNSYVYQAKVRRTACAGYW